VSERLSRWFVLDELVVTSHRDLAAQQAAGVRVPHVRSALVALCTTILDPIRDHVGRPVRVTSGYRCAALNARIGGSPTSQHSKGEAADIQVDGYTEAQLFELWRWVGWRSRLPFGQVIFEDKRPDDPQTGAWLHVSLGAPWRAEERCGQRLTWTPARGYVVHAVEPKPRRTL
jgi:zinc D-Ala-D-Ala carboxypeptidase